MMGLRIKKADILRHRAAYMLAPTNFAWPQAGSAGGPGRSSIKLLRTALQLMCQAIVAKKSHTEMPRFLGDAGIECARQGSKTGKGSWC